MKPAIAINVRPPLLTLGQMSSRVILQTGSVGELPVVLIMKIWSYVTRETAIIIQRIARGRRIRKQDKFAETSKYFAKYVLGKNANWYQRYGMR